MHKFLFILLFNLITITFLSAQNDEDDSEYYIPLVFEKYSLGVSPSSLLNFYSGIQISQDIGISERWNFSLETAYLFANIYQRPTTGFRVKPAIQFMVAADDWAAFHIGIAANYRYTNEFVENTIVNWQERWNESFQLDRTKNLIGAEFQSTVLLALSTRIRAEIGFGLGYGTILVADSNSTQRTDFERVFVSNLRFADEEGSFGYPIASFNFNVHYVISKR